MQPHFDGSNYDPKLDKKRLQTQLGVIKNFLVRHSNWHTLSYLALTLGYPEASVSAQLRNMRKPRFGGHTIDKKRDGPSGLWLYRLAQ